MGKYLLMILNNRGTLKAKLGLNVRLYQSKFRLNY
jgi:hypothetical protein